MSRRDKDVEYKVLQIIKESGPDGILQSKLWKKLSASSREGSRVSLRLEKAGLIERKKVLNHGKWTYTLVAKKRAVNVDSILDIPCFFCLEQGKCGIGAQISPINCSLMSRFVHGKPIPEGITPTPLR